MIKTEQLNLTLECFRCRNLPESESRQLLPEATRMHSYSTRQIYSGCSEDLPKLLDYGFRNDASNQVLKNRDTDNTDMKLASKFHICIVCNRGP